MPPGIGSMLLGRRNSSRRTISRYREFVDAEAGVHGVGLLQRSDSYIRRPRVDGVDWQRLRVDGMSAHHTFRMSRGSRTWDVRSPMRTSLAAEAGPATRPTSFPFDAELSSSSRAEFERHSSRRASERASERPVKPKERITRIVRRRLTPSRANLAHVAIIAPVRDSEVVLSSQAGRAFAALAARPARRGDRHSVRRHQLPRPEAPPQSPGRGSTIARTVR